MENNNQEIESVEKEEVVETKPTKKTTKRKPKKKTATQIRKIMKESEAVIINNDGSTLFYRDKLTGQELELLEYGDSEIVDIEFLRRMKSVAKNFFEQYEILIIDVICDDETITLKDVYDYVGISKYYNDIENPNEDFFDEMLLEDNPRDFEKVINKMNKGLLLQLSNRAIALFKQEKFTDYIKMNLIEEKLELEDLFKDVKDAK